jgi:pimeloyl-ACP methyl ester carboxylesterase
MECRIDDVTLHYVRHGSGQPLVALHGAGVDHREIEAALEPMVGDLGLQRIYPDLPGMGHSTANGLTSNDDVVALLTDFIDRCLGRPVLLLGHSYGAYLARGVAARRPDSVQALALLCPVGEASGELPEHTVVQQDPDAYDALDPAYRKGFDEYFVVRTATTARRYQEDVVPGTQLVDEAALSAVFARWRINIGPADAHTSPALVVAGRCDSTAGFTHAIELAGRYPRVELAVIENAGHALMHERPDLLGPLVRDWVARGAATPSL